MADPSTYRPKPGEIPDQPGVYRFADAHGRVVYVGKAKSLRQRLNSYFADPAGLHPRTQQLVQTAAKVEWTVVGTEVEALQLEYTWIKQYDPRFNVKYRDDKSYPWLAVTVGEEYPRVQVMRGAKRKGTRYFGPYSHAWAIRETVDQLLRVFPVRTCSAGVFKRAGQVGRPCLLGYIDKCSAPCVGRVSADEHRELVEDFCDFMAGNTQRYIRRLEAEMRGAAAELDFERAARLRDDVGALTRTLERNAVVLPDATDADVFALAEDELEAAVQVFHVRGGRVRGQRGWVVEKVEDVTTGQLVERLLQQVYGVEDRGRGDDGADGSQARLRPTEAHGVGARGDGNGLDRGDPQRASAVPREVLVPVEPPNVAGLEAWLAGVRGARVAVRVPQRGDKRTLLETVTTNARQALVLHKTRRAGDLTTRSQALQELQEALGLADAPLRIECYDVSHLQGTDSVASMVVFEDGLPRKAEYRTFGIRRAARDGAGPAAAGAATGDAATAGASIAGAPTGDSTARANDDAAAMREVLTRRFRRYLAEREEAVDLEMGGEPEPDPPAGEGAAPPAAGLPTVSGPVDPETGRPRRFAYPPQLVVVDGGAPQVAAAAEALAALGVTDVAVCGLAKRLEEVWLPGDPYPVVLPRQSQGLYLLQRVRDEAHRFAISKHRAKRSKRMTGSNLDAVAGLGPARSKALLTHFGSVERLRAADVEALTAVPGVGPKLAATIAAALRDSPTTGGVDTATGEIIA